ncbi:hypothetical protein Leryth_018085 [Lithospermum erythrorhizon]|nr:hypothetical protein Leryth_018085 [Lithospermum erythrorhizon]
MSRQSRFAYAHLTPSQVKLSLGLSQELQRQIDNGRVKLRSKPYCCWELSQISTNNVTERVYAKQALIGGFGKNKGQPGSHQLYLQEFDKGSKITWRQLLFRCGSFITDLILSLDVVPSGQSNLPLLTYFSACGLSSTNNEFDQSTEK